MPSAYGCTIVHVYIFREDNHSARIRFRPPVLPSSRLCEVGPGLDSVRLASVHRVPFGLHLPSASLRPAPRVRSSSFFRRNGFPSLFDFDFAVVASQSACTCVAHVQSSASHLSVSRPFFFFFISFIFTLHLHRAPFCHLLQLLFIPPHVRPFCSFVRRYQFNSIQSNSQH